MSSHSSMLIRDSFEKPTFFSDVMPTFPHPWWQVDKGTAMISPDPEKRCMGVAYPHQDGGIGFSETKSQFFVCQI